MIEEIASAQAWTEEKDHNVLMCFAARSALRSLPAIVDSVHFGEHAIHILRASLRSCTAIGHDNTEILAAVDEAADAFVNTDKASFSALNAANAVKYAVDATDETAASSPSFQMKLSPPRRAATDAADASAFASSNNAAAIWAEVNADAEQLDRGGPPKSVFVQPLWRQAPLPAQIASQYSILNEFFGEAPTTWDFWRRWYGGMLNGRPLPWHLQERVAQIDSEDWVKGADHVAFIIKGIEAEIVGGLGQKQIVEQVERILQQTLSCETSARGLGQLIDLAIDAYRREVSNLLPEELEPLDLLPPILNEIACALTAQSTITEKEAQLTRLVTEITIIIGELNNRLRLAKDRMQDKNGWQLFSESFYAKAGERSAVLLTSPVLWGSLVTGGSLLLGPSADSLKEAVAQCFKDVILPEVARDISSSGGAKFEKP